MWAGARGFQLDRDISIMGMSARHFRRGTDGAAKMANEKLVDAVLNFIKSGPESVSYLHRSLQQDGWKGLGVLADFESLLRTLGFTVRHGTNDRGQSRREVTL
jgi:hypothetical protein